VAGNATSAAHDTTITMSSFFIESLLASPLGGNDASFVPLREKRAAT
jgi:hypothetical protein